MWNFVVDKTGKVSGTMHSDVSSENYNISGNLSSSGDLVGTVGLPSKGEFKGKLNPDKKETEAGLIHFQHQHNTEHGKEISNKTKPADVQVFYL